jgi:hypothetical protein
VVEEPNEMESKEAVRAEPQEDEEAVEPEEVTIMGVEPDDKDAEEDPDEDNEEEENVSEEEDEDAVMEPLVMLKPGEVHEEVDEFEETEGDEENAETSEVDEESVEVDGEEELEDVAKGVVLAPVAVGKYRL